MNDPSAALLQRLQQLGLDGVRRVVLHHNRSVVLSVTPRRDLRLHEGFVNASDRVLKAVVRYVKPGTPRSLRRAAHHEIVTHPVEVFVPSPPLRRPVPSTDQPLIAELERLHRQLNHECFSGELETIPLRLSHRMRTRLGEFTLAGGGAETEITISRWHVARDGRDEVRCTLLHEMVHQWQAERGLPVDHGPAFRAKARELGVPPRATRDIIKAIDQG